ncbi:hypothetical protein Sa4125_37360 [Aureimonas sp. SA4125]|uniref:Hpt domain-containing protein n=1 Tax=Aureimonas sp. SA4125 TaxID=2826993 RepID=UPI001CC689F5|nr:Hpt domain-containing protein [Aureimonas sp. SA4125]BDA86194.1 hypothetical protein Sa4125_37360 [Aureimonas sp. SA4125]
MGAMTEIRRTFFEECAEQMVELDLGLSEMEAGSGDAETIGRVFRAVHSIKGGAGAFHLKQLVRFSLTFEGVLNEIRSDRLAPDAAVLALLRRAYTVLGDLVAVSRDEEEVFLELRTLIPGAEAEDVPEVESESESEAEVDLGFTPVAVDFGNLFDGGEKRFQITFKPRPELYANANESARLIRECLALGSGEVFCDTSATPLLDALVPEGAFLAWTIELTTESGEDAIREIFDFAEFDCDLAIERLAEEDGAAEAEPEILDPEIAALFERLKAAE